MELPMGLPEELNRQLAGLNQSSGIYSALMAGTDVTVVKVASCLVLLILSVPAAAPEP